MRRFLVMIEELKPCPFCGGKAKLYPCRKPNGNGLFRDYLYTVVCSNDNCHGKPSYETREEAVKAWNKRIKQAVI